MVSLGSAGVARVAVENLFWPLFALSVVFLFVAHYRAWVRNQGGRVTKLLLVMNSFLVVLFWGSRLI